MPLLKVTDRDGVEHDINAPSGGVLMEQARATPSDAPEERTAYLTAALVSVRRAQSPQIHGRQSLLGR